MCPMLVHLHPDSVIHSLSITYMTFQGIFPIGICDGPERNEIRVATAQGKQGIRFLLFPDREKNFSVVQGNRDNILTVIINTRSILLF